MSFIFRKQRLETRMSARRKRHRQAGCKTHSLNLPGEIRVWGTAQTGSVPVERASDGAMQQNKTGPESWGCRAHFSAGGLINFDRDLFWFFFLGSGYLYG